jgi:hypothetical protein
MVLKTDVLCDEGIRFLASGFVLPFVAWRGIARCAVAVLFVGDFRMLKLRFNICVSSSSFLPCFLLFFLTKKEAKKSRGMGNREDAMARGARTFLKNERIRFSNPSARFFHAFFFFS